MPEQYTIACLSFDFLMGCFSFWQRSSYILHFRLIVCLLFAFAVALAWGFFWLMQYNGTRIYHLDFDIGE